MDRGAWWAIVHGVTKSWTWLSDWHFQRMGAGGLYQPFLTHTHTHMVQANALILSPRGKQSQLCPYSWTLFPFKWCLWWMVHLLCTCSRFCSLSLIHFPWLSKVLFNINHPIHLGLPRWLSGNALSCQCRRCSFNPWVGKIPWSRKRQPPPAFLPGESHGQMSQAGYSPWGHKESDKTEYTHRHKLFRVTICPRGCVSACFSNTCNFFLLYLPVENDYLLSFTGITGPSYQL